MTSQAQTMPGRPGPSSLGELIAETRARRGLTQRELADTIQVAESSVKNWEADRVVPRSMHLAALDRALSVRLVTDTAGRYVVLDAAPEAPRIVILILDSAEAVRAALEELGITR